MTGAQARQERFWSTVLVLLLAGSVVTSLSVAPSREGQFGAWLAAIMLAIAISDFRAYVIPNILTAATAMLGILRAGLIDSEPGHGAILWVVARAAAAATPFWLLMIGYRRWRGRDGLGFGDVKLAAVAGLWLDWAMIFIAIECAALVALAAYGVASFAKRRPLRKAAFVPFGVFLAPAIWIGWLAEAWLIGAR